MDRTAEMLRPTEAAVVARVTLREVNRLIDERILPKELLSFDQGRRVTAAACTLISFYVDSASRLTPEERLFAVNQIGARLGRHGTDASKMPMAAEDWTVRDEFLSIDLASFAERTTERLRILATARALVVCDPQVLGGTPVVRGTRIPVYDVAASVAAGIPTSRILAAYPSLDADEIELAAIYAAAKPPRGRPKSSDAPPEGAVMIAERRITRQSKAG